MTKITDHKEIIISDELKVKYETNPNRTLYFIQIEETGKWNNQGIYISDTEALNLIDALNKILRETN